jgi:AraC family transcriptional regulator
MSTQLISNDVQRGREPWSSIPYPEVRASSLRLLIHSDPPGVTEVPPMRNTLVSIHLGPSVDVSCRRGGYSHRGTAIHGDIDIIPSQTPMRWELKEKDTALVLSISPDLLKSVAEDSDLDPSRLEIRNRFQIRDPELEHIGWALKAEMDSGYPCGRLYLEAMAVSVAARLVCCHSSVGRQPNAVKGVMLERRLRPVLSYIEDNLSHNTSLPDLAAVAGLSVSHFKTLFRESIGLPVHQYIIRRRLELAKALLHEGKMSISQIAFESGFAHQSHLAHHMRRVLGVSPKMLQDMLR